MRKKLFEKKKLFSAPEEIALRTLICRDCGNIIETAEHPSQAYCPRCGGKRLNVKLFPEKINPEAEVATPRKKMFSTYLTPFEAKLKEFSGKTVDKSNFDDNELEKLKIFSDISDDSVTISPNAFETEKLFSKLTISVTKTLELDPAIMLGRSEKEDMIDKLEDNEKLPEKSIMIIKKAHNLPIESKFSETDESWVEDSNIIPDLETEYNNQSLGMEQFVKIIRDRYPDAPENIVDILVQRGAIFVDGSKVTIHKK